MPSLPETRASEAPAGKPGPRRALDLFEVWNRKLHFYIGLYLLVFLWLFAISGLLINHSDWRVSSFWPDRKESRWQRDIQTPSGGTDLERARNVMRQLGIAGEIDWHKPRQQNGHFDFRVNRPGRMMTVETDLDRGQAVVQQIDINTSGVLHVLHTFTGVRMQDPNMKRNWIWTKLWSLSMDAVAVGLIIMVFGSYYMWWGFVRKRRLGFLCLVAGLLACAFFVSSAVR